MTQTTMFRKEEIMTIQNLLRKLLDDLESVHFRAREGDEMVTKPLGEFTNQKHAYLYVKDELRKWRKDTQG